MRSDPGRLGTSSSFGLGGSRKRKKEKVLWNIRTNLDRHNPLEVDFYDVCSKLILVLVPNLCKMLSHGT